jgi:hypothetical protein
MNFSFLLDRLMAKANQGTYEIIYSVNPFTFFMGPITIRANSLYEANRKFDVTYPDYVRRATKEV